MSRRASSRTGSNKETTPVADEDTKQPSPFNVKTVEVLITLMAEHNLSEIDLRDGPQRVRLRRGARQVMVAGAPAPAAPLVPAAAPPVATPAPPAANSAPAAPTKKLLEIKSETVGTFYASPNPESPAFVHVGSRVTPETVVCIIDVMKNMYEIQAGCSGVIAEILAQNQQPVEYNQVLFRVDPG